MHSRVRWSPKTLGCKTSDYGVTYDTAVITNKRFKRENWYVLLFQIDEIELHKL